MSNLLPPEIWTDILYQLDPYMLVQFKLTCKFFNTLINSEYFLEYYPYLDILYNLEEECHISHLIQTGELYLVEKGIDQIHNNGDRVSWELFYNYASKYGQYHLIHYYQNKNKMRPCHVNSGLRGAATNGDIELLKYFFKFKIHTIDKFILLREAVKHNHENAAEFILKKYCGWREMIGCPRTKNYRQRQEYYNRRDCQKRIVEYAAKFGMIFVLDKLLRKGSMLVSNALIHTAAHNQYSCLAWLLDNKYGNNHYCYWPYQNAINCAGGNGNIEIVKLLLNHKNRSSNISFSEVITYAIEIGNSPEIIYELLKLIPSSYCDHQQLYNDCLIYSGSVGNMELCKYFIELGATTYLCAAAEASNIDFGDELAMYAITKKRKLN